ncbi:MAG TPA: glucosaminidase domain-containing protein [Candidatus Dormibacteraeota bacterium]|nr:glucosaminidase domain-containing protein [Candidatus Dormibacteraeota bacterium]
MKYKNRLIVPTIVTLSLLSISTDVDANEVNDHHSQKEQLQETTYNNENEAHNDPKANSVKNNDVHSSVHDRETPKQKTNSETGQNNDQSTSTFASGKNQDPDIKNNESQTYNDYSESSTSEDNQIQENNPKAGSKNSDLDTANTADSSISVKEQDDSTSLDETDVQQKPSKSGNDASESIHELEESSKKSNVAEHNDSNIIREDKEWKNNTNINETEDNVTSVETSYDNEESKESLNQQNKDDNSELENEESVTQEEAGKENEAEMQDEVTKETGSENRPEEKLESKDSDSEKLKLTYEETLKTTDSEKSPRLMTFSALTNNPVYMDSSFAAKLKSSKNSGLYSPVTSSKGVYANFLLDETMYIDQLSKYKGNTYYRINREYGDRLQGWMKKSDLNLFQMWDERKHNKKYSLSTTKGDLLNSPWGTKEQSVKSLNTYNKGSTFQAQKSVKIGALTYYYGKLGNDYGWMRDTQLGNYVSRPIESDASFAAKIRSSKNSGLYSPVTSSKGVDGNFLLDQTIYIDQKAKYAGETYYRVNKEYDDRMQGWIKEKDLNLYEMFPERKLKKTYALSSRSGNLLSDPWGTNKQSIMKLTNFHTGTQFQAQKSVKIGALNFYYGKLGSTYGWISDSKLKNYKPVAPSPKIKTVRHSQSLTQAINTQMNLSSKPQVWANGGGWRNATRKEVTRFLDTSHQSSETWMYTFLDLDRSQNIASSTLNSKLLNGKGTLNNQGSAFLNASKTHGINEVYLISHAIHETGNGSSTLAQGVRLDSKGNISTDGKKYYNMYGVGAYDYNPVLAGARYAQQMGWDTPAKAIVGGARFISQGYFNRGQTTLYSMRWNPLNPGTYQYATDVNWAYATARNLQNYYKQLGIRGQYYTKHIF